MRDKGNKRNDNLRELRIKEFITANNKPTPNQRAIFSAKSDFCALKTSLLTKKPLINRKTMGRYAVTVKFNQLPFLSK